MVSTEVHFNNQVRIFLAQKTLVPVAAFLIGTLLASGCNSQQQSEQKEGDTTEALAPLITASELSELIESDKEGIEILEPGVLEDYETGHIPTAKFLHWVDDMTDPEDQAKYLNPSPELFAKVMSRLGIKNSDRIIIYDRFCSRLSTRLFWTLKRYGHEQVQILDGGARAWDAEFDFSKKTPKVKSSNYEVTSTRDEILAEMDFVKEHLKDDITCLVDGRPPNQFTGEIAGTIFHTKKQHSRKGHIPSAINVFWEDNFNENDTFKSSQELRELYQNAGILPDNSVITYCNEGLHAAPPWFVLTQLLQYENVRLYDSSLAEWAESENPMQVKDATK